MLDENKTLKVGQYLVGADKKLYKITAVYTKSYGVEALCRTGVRLNVLKNGRLNTKSAYYNSPSEFFIIDRPEDILEQYIDNVVKHTKAAKAINYNNELVAKAKYFLEQVKDIGSIEVVEDDGYDYDDDYYDYDDDYYDESYYHDNYYFEDEDDYEDREMNDTFQEEANLDE